MDVADAWYSSGTFLAGAGVVVSVLGTAAIVWVTFRVGLPRRRLYYGLKAAARLLTASPDMRSDLELRRRGEVLADPRVLTIELVSRGRRDIPSDAYNDHEPLRLDVGSRIVEILQVTSRPETLPIPQIIVDGASLNIGPSLIGKRHEITINVLVDGGKPFLTCRSPLIDVEVRQRADENVVRFRLATASIAILAAVVVAAFVIVWRGQNVDRLARVLEILFAPLVAVVGAAVAFYYRGAAEQPTE